jgi:hypothetical protein
VSSRPLIQQGIAALEKMFISSRTSLDVLKALEIELKHRQTPRAVSLSQKVAQAMKAYKDASLGAVPAPHAGVSHVEVMPVKIAQSTQAKLWSTEDDAPSLPYADASIAAANAQPKDMAQKDETHVPIFVPIQERVSAVHKVGELSTQEAYALLDATPATSWEAIEATRQRLVTFGHPERLAQMLPTQRATVQEKTQRVNAAYSLLLMARIPTME